MFEMFLGPDGLVAWADLDTQTKILAVVGNLIFFNVLGLGVYALIKFRKPRDTEGG